MAARAIGNSVTGITGKLGSTPKPDSQAREKDPEQRHGPELGHGSNAYVVEPEVAKILAEATDGQRIQARPRHNEDVVRKAMRPVIGQTEQHIVIERGVEIIRCAPVIRHEELDA
jgi:hypothetical protein